MKRTKNGKYREVKYPRYADALLKCLEETIKSQKELANHIGRSEGSVTAYCQGYTLPSLEIQEEILSFIDERELCRELEDHYYFYTSDATVFESFDQIRDVTLDDVCSLMNKGRPRQAAALIDGLLSWSADEELRLSLQELNFELKITAAAYAEAYKIAEDVAVEPHKDSEIPEFRSLAMLGVVLRAQDKGNLKKAYEYLDKAIGIGYRSQKIPEAQIAIVQRMKAMTEIDGMQTFGKIEKDHVNGILKTLHLQIEHPTCPEERSNAIEAVTRCYLMLGSPKTALQFLETLTQKEIDAVRSLEERFLIRKGVILRAQGELEEALDFFKKGVKRCTQKANFHHLRLANSASISLRELIKSPV